MPAISTFSPDRLDELRQQQPDLGFALYALEPHGLVTLEVMTPDGEMYSFKGETAASALDQAFPRTVSEPPTPEPNPPEPAGSIFD